MTKNKTEACVVPKPYGLLLYPKGGVNMGYRKVGYLEQIWYVIKYKMRELFRRR
jgi:hypothetical protein